MKRLFTLLLLVAALLAQAGDVTVRLPKIMMPGPIDPVCDDETGLCPLLGAAWLGNYASIGEMRASTFYPLLLDIYPDLAGIDEVSVDTGSGSLWLLRPITEHMSLAINEYDFDMFMGTRSESDGAVLLRTEQAVPIVLRMTAFDPGQVKINAVDNQGQTLTWIPTINPTTGELRCPMPEVEPMTMDVVTWLIEPGRDYRADMGGGRTVTLRFYLNGEVAVNGELGQYRAFHLDTGVEGMGLWLCDAQGRQLSALVTPFEGDDHAFNLELFDGHDLGLGTAFATFLPQ